MSLSENIRDYVEVLAGVTETPGNPIEFEKFISESLLYVLKICQTCILQFLSFQWIRDFSLLPIKIPAFYESLVGQTPPGSLFDFLEILHVEQNPLLVGFLNSAFFTLPFSIIHIISIRRLLIQGIPAAVFSFGGYIAGQIVFISCVTFGIQGIIIPWLTLEPLNYIAGLILVARIIFSLRFESLLALKTWHHPKYKKFFIYSFLMAWCEQGAIFQFLSNVTFSANPTILQGFTSNHLGLSIANNFLYITGILLGSVVFTSFWMWFFLKVKNFVLDRTMFYTSKIISDINRVSFICSIAISLATLPYYAYNYILTGPLGFVSEDDVFESTIFSHNSVPDISPEFSYITEGKLMELKLFPFNRGQYLVYPGEDITVSMEELSYRSDYAWVRRVEKLSLDVVSTHIKGQRLAENLGFNRVTQSQSERVLPQETPLIFYRLELNNKMKKNDKIQEIINNIFAPTSESSTTSSSVAYSAPAHNEPITFTDYLKKQYEELGIEYDPIKAKKYIETAREVAEIQPIVEEKQVTKKKRKVNSEEPKEPHQVILDRFYYWYDFEDVSTDEDDRLQSFIIRNNVQGMYLFPQAFIQNEVTLGEIHQQISLRLKQQYNSSWIFKSLLKLDIDCLLNRQPRKFRLSGEHEYDLLAKRNILAKYYDSLRFYTKMPYSNIFEEFFSGSKNLTSQVYNQQFTGTLRNLTKYFSLTVDEELDFSKNNFLEYIASHDFDFLKEDDLQLICEEAVYEDEEAEENDETNEEENQNNDELNLINEDENSVESQTLDFANRDNEVTVAENEEEEEDGEDEEAEEDEEDEENEEDIIKILSNNQNTGKYNYIDGLEKIKRTKLVLKFDQPLYKLNDSDIGPEPHEELYDLINNSNKTEYDNVALDDQYSLPLYVGWDEESRKLMITNKAITRKFAGSYMYVTPEFIKNSTTDTPNEYLSKKQYHSVHAEAQVKNYLKIQSLKKEQANQLIKFTCWPLAEEEFKILPHENTVPYVVLKERKEQVVIEPQDEYMVELFEAVKDKGIPATREWLMEYMLEPNKRDYRPLLRKLTPKKGGFIWPGNTDETIPGQEKRKPRLFPSLALSEKMAILNLASKQS
ncbi:ycf1 (chloroplast) [Auxenochlorella protothecoides x Auxenochlorella symbiontica]